MKMMLNWFKEKALLKQEQKSLQKMLPVAKNKVVDSNTKIESIIGDFYTLFT